MKLKEIGEFGFIERFTPLFNSLLHENQLGIGDDCAIIPANETEDWLVTTDLLMEDVHFLRDVIMPEQLGYKSLAVNLSDIAAMGGIPTGSFLSFAIPEGLDVDYLDAFMTGYHELSAKYGVPLLGGDTTKSLKHFAINVCVMGKCPKGTARKRSLAQAGDLICVTGQLGDSAAGLKIVLDQPTLSAGHEYLIERHHKPEPQLAEGWFLAGFAGTHAMMDISDGMASDLKHILKASGKAATIDIEKLPISETLKNMAAIHQWNAVELAASGGEDYELLMTIAPHDFETIQQQFAGRFGKPLYQIGKITNGEPRITWKKDGREIDFGKSGFNHFE
jgi:thiamine-monophosphate kinase